MPLILGTNSIKDTGYNVANSLRFDDGSSDNLTKTFSGNGTRTTWTFSVWFKRSSSGSSTNHQIFDCSPTPGSDESKIYLYDDKFFWKQEIGNSADGYLAKSIKFRDFSAWYNLICVWDTTNATESNRMKVFLNGNQLSGFDIIENYPDQNRESYINSTTAHYLGSAQTSGGFFDGYMAEVCFIDGTALDPTSFGEFDSDSPTIWKPKDVSGLTFGTNGFYLDFENASSLGADVSGNGNNFTVNNLTSIDQSTDTCTNNFATLNPLTNEDTDITLSQGNLDYSNSGGDETVFASIGVSSGKWYFETKWTNTSNYMDIGVGSANDSDITTPRADMEMAGYYMIQLRTSSPGTRAFNNGSAGSGLGNSALNDINMFAIDMDNNKFYAGKNGTWYSSGDPANNSNPLITMDDGYTTLIPAVCGKSNSAVSVNFGSPSYSISSGNSDANGHGNFEYAVPSGFFALCTKNLAEFG